jgi:hypothetical protein
MINFWDKTVQGGAEKEIETYITNDLDNNWVGKLNLKIQKEDENIMTKELDISVPALEQEIAKIRMQMPSEKGKYLLVAQINMDGEQVESIREFTVE